MSAVSLDHSSQTYLGIEEFRFLDDASMGFPRLLNHNLERDTFGELPTESILCSRVMSIATRLLAGIVTAFTVTLMGCAIFTWVDCTLVSHCDLLAWPPVIPGLSGQGLYRSV